MKSKERFFVFIALLLFAIISILLCILGELSAQRKQVKQVEDLAKLTEQLESTKKDLLSLQENLREYTVYSSLMSRTSAVKAIAHRGYSSMAPENTLTAYKLAKKKGFDIVECDVSFSADNIPVLLHDDSIDRTSNGSGKVSEFTLEELRQYDFGSWKSKEYAGVKIPTFEEFIGLCRNIGLYAYVEIKNATNTQMLSLIEIVQKYGLQDRVTWISDNGSTLQAIRELSPLARLGYVTMFVNEKVIAETKNLQNGQNEVFIDSHTYTELEVELCRLANIPLEVWTINSETKCIELPPYVSGVTSDFLCVDDILYENYIQ